MSSVFEEIAQEAAQKAVREQMIQIARRMLIMGKSDYEEIADLLDLSIEEVKALDESRTE